MRWSRYRSFWLSLLATLPIILVLISCNSAENQRKNVTPDNGVQVGTALSPETRSDKLVAIEHFNWGSSPTEDLVFVESNGGFEAYRARNGLHQFANIPVSNRVYLYRNSKLEGQRIEITDPDNKRAVLNYLESIFGPPKVIEFGGICCSSNWNREDAEIVAIPMDLPSDPLYVIIFDPASKK